MDNKLEVIKTILEILNRKSYEYIGIGFNVPRAKRVRVKARPIEQEVGIRNR